MAYAKNILSVLAAIIIAELVPLFWELAGSKAKATGIGLIWGFLLGSLFSPLFWILAIALFAIFFWASRASHKALRIIFFWIPTLTACIVAATIVSLITFLIIHFRNT